MKSHTVLSLKLFQSYTLKKKLIHSKILIYYRTLKVPRFSKLLQNVYYIKTCYKHSVCLLKDELILIKHLKSILTQYIPWQSKF